MGYFRAIDDMVAVKEVDQWKKPEVKSFKVDRFAQPLLYNINISQLQYNRIVGKI